MDEHGSIFVHGLPPSAAGSGRLFHRRAFAGARKPGPDGDGLTRLERVRFEPGLIRGLVRNASRQELVSVRLVYLPAGPREESERDVLFCDLRTRIPPGEARRFECRAASREIPPKGELAILSVVSRAPRAASHAPRRGRVGRSPLRAAPH